MPLENEPRLWQVTRCFEFAVLILELQNSIKIWVVGSIGDLLFVLRNLDKVSWRE